MNQSLNSVDALLSSSDFGQLRAFIAVAEALNFSRAAEKLGVSSSALSQLVRALEERVGVRLLHRTTRNVSLTEGGQQLFQRVKPAVEELGAALGQTSHLREQPTGPVRIHCFRTAADLYVRPVLKSFHKAHPDVVLDITVDDEVVDLVAGRFDAAIRIGEVIEKDMVAMRLGPDLRQIAVAAPEYLATRGTPQHPRDLVAHACIGWRWPGHERPYKWEFQEDGQWFEVAVQGPIIANSKEFCLQAALDGLGIAFPTEQLSAPHVEAGRLVRLLEAWSAPFPGFFLCFPARRQMAPALRVFIDTVLGERHTAARVRDTQFRAMCKLTGNRPQSSEPMSTLDTPKTTALLGDSATRDYSSKLRHFNAFAEAELKRAIDALNIHKGARVLDAGCGTGEAVSWFAQLTGHTGLVAGIDLSTAHVRAARTTAPQSALIAQADMLKPPFAPRTFDFIWCVNTINHLRDRLAGVQTLVALLQPGGRMALGQGGFLPEMYFAWDARLERIAREADRAYYLDRYGLQERDTTAVRGLVGLLRSAGLQDVEAHTLIIERVAPLSSLDEDYLFQTIFRDTWGERLRPYMAHDDYSALVRLCDPHSPEFALRRPDFHFLQTFTLLTGGRPL